MSKSSPVRRVKEPKLPVQQLIILAICRFAEPVALTSVFPYLPEMIESFGVPKNEVAKWAGFTSAIFSICQGCTAVFWGQASDHFGRKRVILLGLISATITSLLWGFSRSLTWAITIRALAGLSNGNVGIIRTTVAEMVPEKELQPRAFSIMPLVWTIGSIVGPAFGGALAVPAERYPAVFGNSAFFKKFPFALPNLVAAIFFFVGIATGILFLRETLETRKHDRDYGRVLGKLLVRSCTKRKHKKHSKHATDDETAPLLAHNRDRPSFSGSIDTADGNAKLAAKLVKHDVEKPGIREVFTSQTSINLVCYTFLAMHSVASDQLMPIFLHHPVQPSDDPEISLPFKFAGGFGLNSGRIGLLIALYGAWAMAFQFLVFPPIARYFGVLRCLRFFTVYVFPITYFLTPFAALFPTDGTRQAAALVLMLAKVTAVIFAFPCSTIMLTNSAVSLRILGTLNGVATSVSAVGRAAGPAIAGAAFTKGVERGYVITPWWILCAISIIGAIPGFWLVEMPGFGGTDSDSEEDEDEDQEEESNGDDLSTAAAISTPQQIPSSSLSAPDQITSLQTPTPSTSIPQSRSRPILRRTSSTSSAEEAENEDEEAITFGTPQPLPLKPTRTRSRSRQRRMSNPIGMGEAVGPGGSRRLSNSLGQTRGFSGNYE